MGKVLTQFSPHQEKKTKPKISKHQNKRISVNNSNKQYIIATAATTKASSKTFLPRKEKEVEELWVNLSCVPLLQESKFAQQYTLHSH